MPAGSDTALRLRLLPPPAPPAAPGTAATGHSRTAPAAPSGRRLPWAVHADAGRRALTESGYSDRTIRLLTAAPLVVLAANVAVQVVLTPVNNTSPGSTLLTLALMACYTPMVGYLVWSAAHLRRPRAGGWLVAATAVVIGIGVVLIGNVWQMTLAHLLVAVLIVVPRRWAVPAGCLVMVAEGAVDLLVDPKPNPLWMMLVVGQRAGAALVPTWFVATLRRLRATRERLAEQAVLRERIRIDRELTGTVGDSLTTIAERGAAAAALADSDPDRARQELEALVDGSRRALAEARRLIRTYQRVPLRTELDTAVTLLSAAGVSARLVLPDGGLPQYADPELREALRAAVDRLLREQATGGWVLALEVSGGSARLTVSASAPVSASVSGAVSGAVSGSAATSSASASASADGAAR
jgi:signal transduction histidine kinase